MLKKYLLPALVLSMSCVFGADKGALIGVVDFGKCVEGSKFGKSEQESFESIKIRMHKAIEDLDHQLSETATKLQDKDLLDSLSPEAENELKVKFQALNEEMNRYQGQYYQVMQQANMKLVQTMAEMIARASEVVAKNGKYTMIINREAAFHYSPNLDVTPQVIAQLDKLFEEEHPALQAAGKLPQVTDKTKEN